MHPLDRVCVILYGKMDKREERYHKRETGTRQEHMSTMKGRENKEIEKGLVRKGEEIREAERKA